MEDLQRYAPIRIELDKEMTLTDLLTAAVYSPKIRSVLRAYAQRILVLADDEEKNMLALLKAVTNRFGVNVDVNKTHTGLAGVDNCIHTVEKNAELFVLCQKAESEDPIVAAETCREVSALCSVALESLVTQRIAMENVAIIRRLSEDPRADLSKQISLRNKILTGGAGESHRLPADIARSALLLKNCEVYETGIESVDKILRITPGGTLVLGGMSGSGKTTIANQILVNMMLATKLKCLYFSLEVTDEMTYTTIFKYLATKTSDPEAIWQKLPIQVYSNTHNLQGIMDEIRARKAEDPTVRFVLVDYLQIVQVPGLESDETKSSAVAIVALTKLCTELGLFMIVTSQLRKGLVMSQKINGKANRMITPPELEDFRGGGAIANAAFYAGILYLTNPDEDKNCEDSGDIYREKLRILKNKDGRTSDIKLSFEAKNRRFISGWEAFEHG